jgi:hypothetical protein
MHSYENENDRTHRMFLWQPMQCQSHDGSTTA